MARALKREQRIGKPVKEPAAFVDNESRDAHNCGIKTFVPWAEMIMSDNDVIARPTIETLLERIAEIKTSLDEFRKEHQQANAEMRADIVEMRSDMEKGFRRLDRKI